MRECVIGGFFFLRYLCPAIISPERVGYSSPILQAHRSNIINLSKLLQKLANGQKFAEGDVMAPCNAFLAKKSSVMHYLYERLVVSLLFNKHNQYIPN
jgi:hypothetical protein